MILSVEAFKNYFRRKRLIKQLNYRKRYQGLNSHQQVELRKTRRKILWFSAILAKHAKRDRLPLHLTRKLSLLENLLNASIVKYFSILHDPSGRKVEAIPSRNRTIESFSASDCKIFFQFQKDDLYRLLELLKFPETVKLKNRIQMSGEEVLLRGLYEMVGGESKHKIAVNVFGRDFSAQSRALKFFVNHLYDNFKHLLEDNLDWWYRNGFFEASARAIRAKMGLEGGLFEEEMVAHFIDCNCLPTSVVGGGPTDSGANSARWDPEVQRSFYNGWKSIHGLKHQTVDNAFGLTVHAYGPTSLRRNDMALLRFSRINMTVHVCARN